MKSIIKILVMLCATNIYAQKTLTVTDTLSYVKTFETKKQEYIGKPFSVLYDALQVKPKLVSPAFNTYYLSDLAYFNFAGRSRLYDENAVIMLVAWQIPIQGDDAQYYRSKNNAFLTDEEKAFYGGRIVKDIMVFRDVDLPKTP